MKNLKLIEKFEEIIASEGFLLIDTIIRGDDKLRIIEIFIDGERAVTTDDCMRISRLIEKAIDESNLFKNYRLDVSSPGVDRPLKYLVQYGKHINRNFEVNYKDKDSVKKITGKLIRIDGNQLYFQNKNNEIKINFEDITKAKVLISF
ncbi:ribosome maturation factor RimP [Rosettibacter firmus]|uniref:ribosome maturation factor RimP n=1 Tax=Rosettibacter firmus TaxID=3111522 RepID=UPI00336BD3FA